ncbi:MAG: 5-methyltetrahydropteroyltriglutamate--homocysteine S-methyltransferase [Sphingomonas sp.]|nr:5-methyltetrahydropteroyltriglutamate--homocysteine S-methyltransferase [Sphingomonas sp.]
MATKGKRPFRADQVGSLIRPQPLVDARTAWKEGRIDADALREIQHRAIAEVVAAQEALGLFSITDGEFNRGAWHSDFLLKFDNVVPHLSDAPMQFKSEKGTTESRARSLKVTGKLSRPDPIFVDDFRFLKSVASRTAKITLPSPSVLHFRGGRDAVDRAAYPEMEEFWHDLAAAYALEIADLADAGCRYLQLDEVNLAYLCDPDLREQARVTINEDPEDLPMVYARQINACIADKPDDMVVCMHLCRGNFAGNWLAQGSYEPVAEVLFNAINVDGYFLEYDTDRAGGFEPLRFVPKGKTVVLGLVTTKKGEIEDKDELKRRIEEASRFVPLEQLALSPQCGFSSGVGGSTMDIEHQNRKLRLVVETAQEVWGTAE